VYFEPETAVMFLNDQEHIVMAGHFMYTSDFLYWLAVSLHYHQQWI